MSGYTFGEEDVDLTAITDARRLIVVGRIPNKSSARELVKARLVPYRGPPLLECAGFLGRLYSDVFPG